MPTETLVAALSAGASPVRSTLKPLTVQIQPATAKNAELKPLPYNEEGQPPPPAAKVWLQVWEIDAFEKEGHRASPEPHEPSDTNDFLVEVPGYIQQVGTGPECKYEFRVLGAPTKGSGDPLGWFWLELKDATGQPWGGPFPIVGEGEDEVDLACTLEDAAGKRAHASGEFKKGALLHAANMSHIVGSMADEGGLTIGAAAAFNTPEQTQALKEFRKALETRKLEHPDAKPEEVRATLLDEEPWVLGAGGKSIADIDADDAIPRAAERLARSYHAVGLQHGELLNVYLPLSGGLDAVVAQVATIRQKAHAEALRGQGDPPKVKRLVVLSRGDTARGLKVGPDANAYLGADQVAPLAQALAPHLASDAVIAILAGGCGRGDGDASFGAAPRGDAPLGQGSFARALFQALKDAGATGVAVWAPTGQGHPTANATLRAFASQGACDLIWLTGSSPENRLKQAIDFLKNNVPEDTDDTRAPIVRCALWHPGAKIGEVLATAYPAPAPAQSPAPGGS